MRRALRAALGRTQRRRYNFASDAYAKCLAGAPPPPVDTDALRADALAYIEAFDAGAWHADPVTTVLGGQTLGAGGLAPTTDAFGVENGAIRLATRAEVARVAEAVLKLEPAADLRAPVRACEAELFGPRAAELIGNQALDFRKQDGVTEIEESLQAAPVERRLVDALLADERAGRVRLSRAPVLVACVSNFSNFLDLSRKTLRNLEAGAPCVVLSRSSATQHCFRWFQLLAAEMDKRELDPALLTYVACSLEDQRFLMKALGPDSPLHITCARSVAAEATSWHGHVVSSTGGPNTLVAAALTPGVAAALRESATIEHAGQCTALRHAVVAGSGEAVAAALADPPAVADARDALARREFAGVFPGVSAPPAGYGAGAVGLKTSATLPGALDEHWRVPLVDATLVDAVDDTAPLAAWLREHQPISLAVNDAEGAALRLFEETALVVYTVGDSESPASTCQARPQDGEIFGEVPPRREMRKHTRFPVLVPSAAPAYGASYDAAFLEAYGPCDALAPLLRLVGDPLVRGYASVVADYVLEAAGPRRGSGARTALWGLQRPPLGLRTVLRGDADTTLAELVPSLAPFYVTSARAQVVVSLPDDSLVEPLRAAGVAVVVEGNDAADATADAFDVVAPGQLRSALAGFPLAQQFVSLYLPMGHVKSTKRDDEAFVSLFGASEKWVRPFAG